MFAKFSLDFQNSNKLLHFDFRNEGDPKANVVDKCWKFAFSRPHPVKFLRVMGEISYNVGLQTEVARCQQLIYFWRGEGCTARQLIWLVVTYTCRRASAGGIINTYNPLCFSTEDWSELCQTARNRWRQRLVFRLACILRVLSCRCVSSWQPIIVPCYPCNNSTVYWYLRGGWKTAILLRIRIIVNNISSPINVYIIYNAHKFDSRRFELFNAIRALQQLQSLYSVGSILCAFLFQATLEADFRSFKNCS